MLWWLYTKIGCNGSKFGSRAVSLAIALVAACVQRRFAGRVRRLRKLVAHRKLKVLFVIGDDCKWKAQSLYEAMLASDAFDPYVATTVMDIGWIPDSEQASRLRSLKAYFGRKGVRTVDACAEDGVRTVPLRNFAPDIVIYLQPWGIARNQHPIEVSKYAITCYLPYGIFSYGNYWEMYQAPFIKFVQLYFIEHQGWKSYFETGASKWRQGSRLIPTGNPYCDLLLDSRKRYAEDGSVIYAPHWSMDASGYCGTFDKTGKLILDIAKRHPEIKWVFKPHPMLKYKAVECGVMSAAEIEAYYQDWGKLGSACYDSDYFPLFHRSSVLITDCQTFLTEYLLTGKPIIRLTPSVEEKMLPPARRLFDAFYNVRTESEILAAFQKIVLDKKDDLRNVREQVKHDLGYDDVAASKKIMSALGDVLLLKN